jgi:hypothetical protein
MKTVLEQLMEINAKLAELETAVMGASTSEFESCCNGECDCSPEDDEPEYDGAGFTYDDRVVDGQYRVREENIGETVTPDQANVIVFTKAELVAFAGMLTERVVAAAKEAVTDTGLDEDELVTLELNTWGGNTINIELDKDAIVESIHSEIDDTIDTDYDAVEIEVDDILRHMAADKED